MHIKMYSASFCGPCRQMYPLIENFDNITKVDMEESRDEAVKLGVVNIPTFIKFDDDGKEIERHVGGMNLVKLTEFAS